MTVRVRERPGRFLPGALAGLAGVLGFLVVHHLWIVPIWGVLPLGVLVGALGGMAAQVAYLEVGRGRPGLVSTILSVAAVAVAILTPSLLLAELEGPVVALGAAGTTVLVSTATVWRVFLVDLLLVSTATGALAGWLLGRTRRAVWTTALAGLALALGPGHNLPFFVGTAKAGVSLGLTAAAIAPASIVLVLVLAEAVAGSSARG